MQKLAAGCAVNATYQPRGGARSLAAYVRYHDASNSSSSVGYFFFLLWPKQHRPFAAVTYCCRREPKIVVAEADEPDALVDFFAGLWPASALEMLIRSRSKAKSVALCPVRSVTHLAGRAHLRKAQPCTRSSNLERPFLLFAGADVLTLRAWWRVTRGTGSESLAGDTVAAGGRVSRLTPALTYNSVPRRNPPPPTPRRYRRP
jgi:hypothetical protein